MIKHFCDMCGDEIHDGKTANFATIKNNYPLVEIRVELCDACHTKFVNQLFPSLGEKISVINARIQNRKDAKKTEVVVPDGKEEGER